MVQPMRRDRRGERMVISMGVRKKHACEAVIRNAAEMQRDRAKDACGR
jgi:hypothetical protein